jgi:alpha-mannosidase
LEIDRPPGEDPRLSYYTWRSAWADAAAELWRSDSLTSQATEARRLVAPHFVDIRGRHRLAVLCGGLPFHVRSGERTLDTLLVAGKERLRRFRLGIGVGLEYPLAASLELLTPQSRIVTPTAGAMGDGSGWFFHIDRKNVIATAWEPLMGRNGSDGFRVRLLETQGRPAQVRLSAFRAVGTARRTDLLGRSAEDLHIDDGRVCLRVDAYGWTQVEARW